MFFGSFCLRRVKRSKKILEAGGKKWEDTFFHYCGGRTKIFISQKYKFVKLITVNIKKNQIKISVKIILMKSGMKWNGNWNEIKRICIYITFYFSVYSFFSIGAHALSIVYNFFVFWIVFCLWLFVYTLVTV